MKLALGADHAGFELKEHLRTYLEGLGHEVEDLGTHSSASIDYPDYAAAVARSVASGQSDRGVLVCGSGVGMEIAANKVDGVRAANVPSTELARLSRAHNDANVVALGARFLEPSAAEQIVRVFLETPFDGGRHTQRVQKISALEH